jgi:hypothetical protein
VAVLVLVLLAGTSWGTCPPDCLPGGGPAASDCLIQWSGVPSLNLSCSDGDPSCDTDGQAQGTCTFGLQACINVPAGTCTPIALAGPPSVTPSNSAVAQALGGALAALDPTAAGCTAPGLAVPVKVSLAGLKPGRARLAVTAVASGKRDRDRLKLICLPGASPSFSGVVQAIFTSRCTTQGCHDSFRAGDMNLEAGRAYAALVDRPATVGRLREVKAGSVRQSYLARKILGQRILGSPMPSGCPGNPPLDGCLTDAELYAILSWIQGGAPNN